MGTRYSDGLVGFLDHTISNTVAAIMECHLGNFLNFDNTSVWLACLYELLLYYLHVGHTNEF